MTKWFFSPAFALFAFLLVAEHSAVAAGKARPQIPPTAPQGKLVIAIEPVRNVGIEMPDGALHDFGEDFYSSITTRLTQNTTGRQFVITSPQQTSARMLSQLKPGDNPGIHWTGTVVPAATVRVTVEAMTFSTGSKGERMFYGFNERFRTPFNDGYSGIVNEFPLREISFQPNWFDTYFDPKGSGLIDSHSGLDLGDGFQIDAIFAWLAVKYALYNSQINLRLDIDAPLAGRTEFRTVSVTGSGFFFDISGAYQGYSAGIMVARKDAMTLALHNAEDGSQNAIISALSDLPLTGRIDAALPDGTLLLGTGPNSNIPAGTRYAVLGTEAAPQGPTVIEVSSSPADGAVGTVVLGNATLAKPGSIIREMLVGLPPALSSSVSGVMAKSSVMGAISGPGTVPAAVESVTLPPINLPQSNLTGLAPVVSWWQAALKLITDAPLLAYRIWRYYQYDQTYHQTADGSGTPADWANQARSEVWAKQIGLANVQVQPLSVGSAPIVAVLDSGVDYNHPAIHDALWSNSQPVSDTQGLKDLYGWDFISGDNHPYDDGYHGTQLASMVLAVAPNALIMPLKVFNPWGITSSGAIYGAFQYAVDHGAKIILCGWATRQQSQAILQGVAYAKAHGVLVVAAAGDRGDDLSKVAAYPAALSVTYDNVLTVTGVDSTDKLVTVMAKFANFNSSYVGISAPGQDIHVAEPRNSDDIDTSTGIAAAIVAGAAARAQSGMTDASVTSQAMIAHIRADADTVPALSGVVSGGLRLRIRD